MTSRWTGAGPGERHNLSEPLRPVQEGHCAGSPQQPPGPATGQAGATVGKGSGCGCPARLLAVHGCPSLMPFLQVRSSGPGAAPALCLVSIPGETLSREVRELPAWPCCGSGAAAHPRCPLTLASGAAALGSYHTVTGCRCYTYPPPSKLGRIPRRFPGSRLYAKHILYQFDSIWKGPVSPRSHD